MTRPQITGLTNFNSTKNNVITENIVFRANIFNKALPLLGADAGNVSISFLGKERKVILTGEFTGTESDLKAFREEIENEADDPNQSSKTYTTSNGATITPLLIDSIDTTKNLISEGIMSYTITLITSRGLFT